MIRGNMDIVCLQPEFKKSCRDILWDLYAAWMPRDYFDKFMNDVVIDEELPGSTPKDPKKYVRTLFASPFMNTVNPQLMFHYNEAEKPEPYHLLAPEYWKENQDALNTGADGSYLDPIAELDKIVGEKKFF